MVSKADTSKRQLQMTKRKLIAPKDLKWTVTSLVTADGTGLGVLGVDFENRAGLVRVTRNTKLDLYLLCL